MCSSRFQTLLIWFAILILNGNAIVEVASSPQEPWYSKVPDYYLHGVPKDLVANEKNRDAAFALLFRIFGGATGKPERIAKARRLQKAQQLIPETVQFPCPTKGARSDSRPKNVHSVGLGDIDVVVGLGDSQMAGLGALATNALELFDENRGVSAFIGGAGTWREFTTLPNMLKLLNPRLTGYSYQDGISKNKGARFNIAESGAMSHDLFQQARVVVEKIKNDSAVDFQNDWKLVTIALGTNNFCSDSCWAKNLTESAEEHRQHLLKTFRYFRDKMPRTIINYMASLGIFYILKDEYANAGCDWNLKFECSCLFGRQNENKQHIYLKMPLLWQAVDEEVYLYPEFRKKDDFAILLQPMLTDLTLPTVKDSSSGERTVDGTYLSVDCFHYSQKMNSKLAIAAWNSLLTPDGVKSRDAFEISKNFICPEPNNPYIKTWKNSIV